jgi:hypothetical protein
MPSSRPRRIKGHGAIVPSLSKQERITELLRVQAQTFGKELSLEEIDRWEQDLARYPIAAIEFAFEEHRMLGMFFPVPSQILDICKTWREPIPEVGCGSECRARHGKGYGETDLLWLYHKYQQTRAKQKSALKPEQVTRLLDELDRKRAHSPGWRA